jgi:hypothetical protein
MKEQITIQPGPKNIFIWRPKKKNLGAKKICGTNFPKQE